MKSFLITVLVALGVMVLSSAAFAYDVDFFDGSTGCGKIAGANINSGRVAAVTMVEHYGLGPGYATTGYSKHCTWISPLYRDFLNFGIQLFVFVSAILIVLLVFLVVANLIL